MARPPTPPLSDKEKKRIVDAIRSGVAISELYESGRFAGVSRDTLAAIVDAHGLSGRMRPQRKEAGGGG